MRRSTRVNSTHWPGWFAICKAAGDGAGSSFSQRNLFELALDRLAAEFAAVNKTDRGAAVSQLNAGLAGGKNQRHRPAENPQSAARA